MREKRDQNNSEYGLFLRSEFLKTIWKMFFCVFFLNPVGFGENTNTLGCLQNYDILQITRSSYRRFFVKKRLFEEHLPTTASKWQYSIEKQKLTNVKRKKLYKKKLKHVGLA